MKKTSLCIALVLSTIPLLWSNSATGFNAGGIAEGISAGIDSNRQEATNNQWREMSKAWVSCIQSGGGDSCGPAPEQPVQQASHPIQTFQYRGEYDLSCMSLCQNAKYEYTYCQMQCRNR